jgi:hypothetical protein
MFFENMLTHTAAPSSIMSRTKSKSKSGSKSNKHLETVILTLLCQNGPVLMTIPSFTDQTLSISIAISISISISKTRILNNLTLCVLHAFTLGRITDPPLP